MGIEGCKGGAIRRIIRERVTDDWQGGCCSEDSFEEAVRQKTECILNAQSPKETIYEAQTEK